MTPSSRELVALPSAAAVRAHREALARGGVAFGPLAVTFAELFSRVVRAVLPDARTLDDAERRAVLRALLADTLGEARATPPNAAALGDALAALIRGGVEPEDLAAAERASVASRARIARLRALLADYRERLRALDATDADGGLWLAAARLRAADPARDAAQLGAFAGVDRIVLRGVIALSRAELELLHRLAVRLAPATEVVLEIPEAPAASYGRLTARLFDRIEALGERGAFTAASLHAGNDDTEGARVAHLLAEGPAADSPPVPTFVAVLEASRPDEEAARVATFVRERLAGGAHPSRVVVCVPGDAAERAAFEDALDSAGVPVARALSRPLPRIPVVRWLLSGVAFGAAGSDPEAAGRWLSSTYARAWLDGAGQRLGQALLGLRRPFTPNLGALRAVTPHLPADTHAVYAGVVDTLAVFSAPSDYGTFLDRVARFVTATRVEASAALRASRAAHLRALVAGSGDWLATREAEAVGLDLAALEALRTVLETEARAGHGARVAPAASHLAFLEGALSRASASVGASTLGGVRVLAPAEALGVPWDTVVLARLVHGVFPGEFRDNPFLPGRDARAVMAAERFVHAFDLWGDGHDEPFLGRGEAEERLLFVSLLRAAASAVLLSRSMEGADRRSVAPSPFFDDVVRGAIRHGVPVSHVAPLTLSRAHGDGLRQAVASALGAVPPGTRAEELVRLPAPDLGADPLALASAVRRAGVERGRIAFALGASRAAPGAWTGAALPTPDIATLGAPLAVTSLDTAAACPFQFFAKHVLAARPAARGEFDPDAAVLGTAAHGAFEAAMVALRGAGLDTLTPSAWEKGRAVAERAVDAHLTSREERFAMDDVLHAVWAARQRAQVLGLVEVVYGGDATAANSEDAPLAPWRVVDVEWRFGRGSEATAPPLALEGEGTPPVHLEGRVDLVEARGDAVRVSDVKSSGAATLKKRLKADALGTAEFQLPVYGEAVRREVGKGAAWIRYLSLRDTESVEPKEDTPSAVDLARTVTALVGELRAGRFAVSPRAGACDFCDYSAVCRIPRGAPDREDEE